jgi:hypothetical protein
VNDGQELHAPKVSTLARYVHRSSLFALFHRQQEFLLINSLVADASECHFGQKRSLVKPVVGRIASSEVANLAYWKRFCSCYSVVALCCDKLSVAVSP